MKALIGAVILYLVCGAFLWAMSWVFAPGIVVVSWKATFGVYLMVLIALVIYWLARDVE